MCDNVSGVLIRAALLQRLDLLVRCVQQVRWAAVGEGGGGGGLQISKWNFVCMFLPPLPFFPPVIISPV